ncbi:glycosyltransferase family 2 protein [bacterium]|nr:glycosyltransferase family 2 protein [bacterium]
MSVLDSYLSKQRVYSDFISSPPSQNLLLSVVIPVHNEPDILSTLKALANCEPTNGRVEVILVINASEQASENVKQQNLHIVNIIEKFVASYSGELDFHYILNNDLPQKHAGVGLARKIGMDEAVSRFAKIKQDKGIIVCFDADCTCAPNYLIEIENAFKKYAPKAMSIRFEHPLSGVEFDQRIYDYITDYELHLRVYKNAIAFAGLPYGYHTVGSSMAVSVMDYCKQGGMNKRKAGEDFYFMQKFIQLGPIYELNSTCVYPSPRVSDRVPFGTGRAIGERVNGSVDHLLTYNMQSFYDLKELTSMVPKFYESFDEIVRLPVAIKCFFKEENLISKLLEIKRESASLTTFVKRFYAWFDAFQLLKFVHFARDEFYPNQPINLVAHQLLIDLKQNNVSGNNTDLLRTYRAIDFN